MSGGTTQTTQKSEPWPEQKAALQNLYAQSNQLQPQQYYPGQTVAELNPLQTTALSRQYALGGNNQVTKGATGYLGNALSGQQLAANPFAGGQYVGEGMQYLEPTARGDYLTGGEGFNRAYDAAAGRITPGVRSQFEKSGRLGSGLARGEETRQLGDAFAGLYGDERNRQLTAAQAYQQGISNQRNQQLQAYGAERGLQNQALSMAPAVNQMQYGDISNQFQAGLAHQLAQQANIDANREAWQFQQQAPYNLLASRAAIAQGGPSFQSTTASTPRPGLGSQLLGLGGSALGAWGGSFIGDPLGGAALGGQLGQGIGQSAGW